MDTLVDLHDPDVIDETEVEGLCGSPVSFVDCLTEEDFNTPEKRLACAFISILASFNEIILV